MDIDQRSPLPSDLKVTLVGEVVIKYCPWCGKDLERHFRKNIDSLIRDELSLDALVERFYGSDRPTTTGQKALRALE